MVLLAGNGDDDGAIGVAVMFNGTILMRHLKSYDLIYQ